MPLVVVVVLLSACVLVVLAGYALNTRRATHKTADRESDSSPQNVGQQIRNPEPSDQPEALGLVTPASSPDINQPSTRISIAPAEPSVETAVVVRALESVATIVQPANTLTLTEEPSEIDLHLEDQSTQASTEMQYQPIVETAVSLAVLDPLTTVAPDGRDEGPLEEGQLIRPQKQRRISPEKRGGRARAEGHGRQQEETRKCLPRTSRPEIVCWKRDREWVLAVETPEVLKTASVLQNGVSLAEDDLERGCWRLADLRGAVNVFTGKDEHKDDFSIELGNENCLVFKLSGVGRNHGRRVKKTACGSFLVVVPADWERDEEESDPLRRVPNMCL